MPATRTRKSGQRKRCKKGTSRCINRCINNRGTRIHQRCPTGERRCPAKVGTCLRTHRYSKRIRQQTRRRRR